MIVYTHAEQAAREAEEQEAKQAAEEAKEKESKADSQEVDEYDEEYDEESDEDMIECIEASKPQLKLALKKLSSSKKSIRLTWTLDCDYKVRGVVEIDGEKIYTKFSKISSKKAK